MKKKHHQSKFEIFVRVTAAIIIVGMAAGGAIISGSVPVARAETSWCGFFSGVSGRSRIEPDLSVHYHVLGWEDSFAVPDFFSRSDDPFYVDIGNEFLSATEMGGIVVHDLYGDARLFDGVSVLTTLHEGENFTLANGTTLIEIDNPGDVTFAVSLSRDCPGTPTPAAATPFPPQPTACVTAMPSATATRQATPTAFIISTPTPTRTPTPGGPTATPGPSATGTPVPSFDSGIATFDQSLQPWTASEQFSGGGIYLTTWLSSVGPDNRPGVAFMRDVNNLTFDPLDVLTTTEPMSGSLTYSRPSGMFFPLRLTGTVRWAAQLLGGEHASLRVWYFDPDYSGTGQGVWITAHGWQHEYSSIWDHFSFLLVQHGGSGHLTAIAISEDFSGEARGGEGALLDDLHIYSGSQAVAGSFPTCQGSGAGGPAPIATKTCKIHQIVVDVYSTCTAPEGIDVAAWLAYVTCRVLRYFTFLPQNQQQISDLITRQNADEPFGTFIEMSNITGVIGQMLRDISSVYANNTVSYRTINWSTLFNFRQLDDITTLLHIPNDPGVIQRYRARCPDLSQDSMNSKLFRDYGCLVIVFTRDQIPLFGAWQWVIDISSIIGLVMYARSILSKPK